MFLLDGRKIKEEGLNDLKNKINLLDKPLGLAVIQVGNDLASSAYVLNKEKTAKLLNCKFLHIKFDDNVSNEEIITKINELNNDISIDGILVQMPIPINLDSSLIQNAILPSKDIDGLTDISAGLLIHNKDTFIPCTPLGIFELLKYYNIDIIGKHVVIVGRSILVGKPLASLLLNNNATVTVCHSKTKNLNEITKTADILISAVGRPNTITKDMIKENIVVVDVGINRVNGKLCGDVDFDSIKNKVNCITPVPGGVGQMTILELFNNLYKSHNLKK